MQYLKQADCLGLQKCLLLTALQLCLGLQRLWWAAAAGRQRYHPCGNQQDHLLWQLLKLRFVYQHRIVEIRF